MVRQNVYELSKMGPLPSELDPNVDLDKMDRWVALLHSIEPPVTDDEARILIQLFGPYQWHEVEWTLVHLIETAPNWPLEDVLQSGQNEWIDRLIRRSRP